MTRNILMQRSVDFDATLKSGSAQCGDTKRYFHGDAPSIGILGAVAFQYQPHSLVFWVSTADGTQRQMTTAECIEIENRLYEMNRGAGDPWRPDWGRP